MRILRVPRLLGVGRVVALLGVVGWLVGGGVSGALAWALVALGLAVVVVRRRSVAVALVTAQSLLLGVVALARGGDRGRRRPPRVALAVRARRARRRSSSSSCAARASRARCAPASPPFAARPASRSALALALTWLVPSIGLESGQSERAVLALVAFGAGDRRDCAARRSSSCSGSCWPRTASRSRRSSSRAGASLAIELGVALDLTLVALVAAVFHERIFAEFGTGDTAALESLRD